MDCLDKMTPQIRAAEAGSGTILIYVPYGIDLVTTLDAKDYVCDAFEMANKRYMKPEQIPGEKLAFYMPQCNADVLYILTRK